MKIRGHRIELGDVEAGLRSIDGVADALAAVTGEGERRELVAVIVPETTSDTVSDDQTTTTSALTSTERDIAPLIDAIMARNQAEALTDAQSRDFRRIHSLVTEAALDAMTAQIARITEADPTTTATRDDIIAGTGAYHHSALVNRWINELERVGRIRLIDDRVSVVDTTTLTGDNTTSTPDHDQWSEIYRLDERAGYGRRQLDYVHSCLTELPGLLDGRVDPLSLLFPEGDMAIARASYGQNRLSTYLNRMCASAITHHARTLTAAGRTCRILEIGAGVGGTTADVIAELPDTGVDYLFTDVSRYFIDAAAHEWPQVRTALFDINTPPEEQGIQPGSLDVVLCANVLHNAQNIDDTLLQIERLLAPGGLLVIIDSTATNAPLMASMEFKEGLGNTTDARVTTGSPFLTFTQWQDAISASPLESIAVLPEPGTVLELGAQHVFIVRKPQPASTVLAGRGLDLDRIRADAIDALPVHMNPRRIQIVDTLPLTTNGKRDRTAVARLVTTDTPPTTPQPSQPSQPTVPPAATTDPVIDAWRDVLDLDPTQPVHEDANFHDLGGDSLLLARCIGQMRRATHRDDLPSWDETLRAIVANPTVDGCRRALGLTTPPEETPQAENSPGRGQATPTPAPSTGPTVTLVDTTPPSPSGTITRPANGPRLTPLLPPPGDEHDSQTTTGEGSGIHDLTVMVHDGSGGTGPYTALLPELAARNVGPVVGIERSAGDNYLTTPPEELFHDLIERYTLSILETGAHRVHVVGYCMGGLLAAGIADRLAACGVDTSATVLSSYRIPFTVHDETILDFSFARLLGSTPQDMGIDLNEEALGRALRAARHDGHDDITTEVLHHYADENLRAQLTDVPPTSADRIDHFLHTDAGAPWSRDTLDALREVYLHSLAAVAAWAEPPITAPVTFLRQRDPLSFLPDLGDDMTAFWADTCRGGLDIIDVDGDHFTCLDTAHAPAVADLVASQSPWSPGHSPMTRTPTPPAHTPHPADNPTSKTGTDPKGKR